MISPLAVGCKPMLDRNGSALKSLEDAIGVGVDAHVHSE
jgi:hypothetical protein